MVKHHTNLCMRIGIDLDGVIFDSEKLYRIYSELYDIQDLKKNSIRNNREIKFQDRYSWSEEETDGFVKKYHRKIFLFLVIQTIKQLENHQSNQKTK